MRNHSRILFIAAAFVLGALLLGRLEPVEASDSDITGGLVIHMTSADTYGLRVLNSAGTTVYSVTATGSPAFSGVVQAPNGTAAAPGLTFASDLDTGLYRVAANDLGFAVAGAQEMHITATTITVPSADVAVTGGVSASTTVSAGLGTVGAPGFTFAGDPNTGVYSTAADQLAVAVAGAQEILVTATTVSVPSANLDLTGNAIVSGIVSNALGAVGTPSYAFTGDLNTGLYSPAADQVALAAAGGQEVLVTATAVTIPSASLDVTGPVTSSATTGIGWAIVDGADNTSCETTCTFAAVFGIDLAAGATAPVIVGSSAATADVCMCAGAS